MHNLDFQPKMVGREDELKQLQAYLDKAVDGEGNTLFISGEAGIGKTRLVNELKQIAQSRGFQILSGNCMYESLTPFMPVMDALRSGGLESLFAEEAPRVEAVYLVTNTGLLIKEVVREETELNPDLFVSMFTTVTDFLNESLSKLSGEEEKGALNSLGYQNYRILIERYKDTNLVVILSGRENEFLLNDMREILLKITRTFKRILKEWGGDEKKVAGLEELLKPLITSGKYDGIYYGKDDPKIRRNLLFENVSLGLMRQAQQSPTILCIEDLQWADPSLLALMHYLARNTRESGLFIMSTYRPEDVAAMDGKGHPLVGTMQLMDREDLYEKMDLMRLPEGSMDEFLITMLGKIDFTDEFKDRIYKETEGNPLFVIQLMKFLVEEKIIKTDNGTWKLAKDLKDIEISSKIYNVISRRLNRLEKEDRKVLDYASVIGETFKSSILKTAMSTNKTKLLEQLRGLEQTHRLIHSHKGNFKFDHAKIKEVLYIEIPEELRRDYHSTIAKSVETLNKDNRDKVIGDLAFHYYQCRNKKKALLYLIKAAEKAKKDYSNEEAIRFYTEALEFEANAQKRTEIFEAQGDIYRLSGDYEKSIKLYHNAIELIKEKHKIAEIKCKIGMANEKFGAYSEMLRICREALELVKGEECKEEASALWTIGWAYVRLGNYNIALESFEKCLKIGHKINDHKTIAESLKGIGSVYEYRGDYDKAIEVKKKSLESWIKLDDLRNIGKEKFNIAFSLGRLGKYEKALEYYEDSWRIAEKIGAKDSMAYISWGQAEVYYGKGDLNRALNNAHHAFEISRRIGLSEIIAESYRMFGMIYGKQKKWEESIKNFEESFRIFKETGMKMEIAENHFEFGLMWKAKGDVDKAKEHFHQALDIFNKLNIEKKVEMVKVELEAL